MFCRKKKPKKLTYGAAVFDANPVSWRSIEEDKVVWPENKTPHLDNENPTIKQNGLKISSSPEDNLDYKEKHVEDRSSQIKEKEEFRVEKLKQITYPPPRRPILEIIQSVKERVQYVDVEKPAENNIIKNVDKLVEPKISIKNIESDKCSSESSSKTENKSDSGETNKEIYNKTTETPKIFVAKVEHQEQVEVSTISHVRSSSNQINEYHESSNTDSNIETSSENVESVKTHTKRDEIIERTSSLNGNAETPRNTEQNDKNSEISVDKSPTKPIIPDKKIPEPIYVKKIANSRPGSRKGSWLTTNKKYVITDSNGNLISDNEEYDKYNYYEPKKSDAQSIDMRLSSASILSNSSDGSSLSTGTNLSAVQLRRKGHHDDEVVESVEIIKYEKSNKEMISIRKALESNPFIIAVAANAIVDLIAYMAPIQIIQGEVIMRQGEEGDSMYVSKSGEYQVEVNSEPVQKFHDNHCFGELAILYNKPRNATIVAITDGQLWQLNRKAFKRILRQTNITENDSLLEFLRKVPQINEASDTKLRKIAGICESRYYPRDAPIVHEGQRGNEFFIVKTGTAIVSKVGKGKIKELKRGDFFGEKALLTEDNRKATVTAGALGADCLVLSRRDFHTYLGELQGFLAEGEEETDPEDSTPSEPSKKKQRHADVTLKELKKVKKLGEGGFGVVNLVKSNKGRLFALKSMSIDSIQKEGREANAFNERDIQKACDSVFIVQMYRTYMDPESRYLYYLLEYCPRGELFRLLRKKKHFSEVITRFTAACVLEALDYLHRRKFVYLDLKPENIFIDYNGYPKLGDFGNALKLERGQKTFTFTGTPEYMAPEIFQQRGYDKGADYWAFGILLYEMLMGKTPFMANDYKLIAEHVTHGLTGKHFAPGFHKHAKDLIKKLIELNENKRLGMLRGGADLIRRHEWFKDIDFNRLRSRSLRSPLLSLYKN